MSEHITTQKAAAAALTLLLIIKKRKSKRRRFAWVRPLNVSRKEKGEFHSLIGDMRLLHDDTFIDYFRMTTEQYDELLRLIGPSITLKTTHYREPISASERLSVTLRFLATGDSFRTIAASFRLGKSTVCNIVHHTCSAIWTVLQPFEMPTPTAVEWRQTAHQFKRRWDFPNCAGSIDGKHIKMECPANGGSLFWSHKGAHSLVLMACSDASYRFTAIDVGAYGSESDAGIFAESAFGKAVLEKKLDLPPYEQLPGTRNVLPWVFVADEAFPLRENLMRPFPGQDLTIERRIFNYRLSRARRMIENNFGILAVKFRCFRRPLTCTPKHVEMIVKAACVLHNFLRNCEINHPESPQHYCPPRFADYEDGNFRLHLGQWRKELAEMGGAGALRELERVGSNNSPRIAQLIRDTMTEYFYHVGSVPWQMISINAA